MRFRPPVLLLALAALEGWAGSPTFRPAPALVGDGRTGVILLLEGAPQGVSLEVSAGTVRGLRATPAGPLEIDYLPPRTAAAMEVKVVARQGKTRLARMTLAVQADPGPPAPASGPFRVRGAPPVSGGPAAELVYSGAARNLRLWVSAGEAQALGEQEGGWRYTPPPEGYPRAVIAAVTDPLGELQDWAVVPVLGEGQVEARTEPDASVRFRIGAEEFGPVRTDASGRARMVVRAAPGVRQAVAVVTDRLGNVREQRIELGAPAEAALLALCTGDGQRVVLLALDPSGVPAAVDQLQISAASGTVGALRQLAPGRFEASVGGTAPGAGEVLIHTRWGQAPGLETRCALPPRAPPKVTPLAPAPAPPPAVLARQRWTVIPRLGLALAGPRLTAPLGLVDLGWSPASLPLLTLGVQTGLTLSSGEYTTTTQQPFRATSWLVPILARASGQLALGAVEPYLTVQAGVAVVGASTRSELTGLTSTLHPLPAAGAAAGLHWPLGPGQLTGELSYLRGWAPQFSPGEQLNAWLFTGGYRLDR